MNLNEHLSQWLRGNTEAIALILAFHEVAEFWDDLIDDDSPVGPEAANKAFYAALITIPRNGFYQEHFARLSPIIESAIFDWHTANRFEDSQPKDGLQKAYVLRSRIFSLTTMAASIVAGPKWAREVSLELWALLEPWDSYAKEFGEK